MLIHFGSALTGAEEESVLVPVGEHREAATAGGLPSAEQGKDLTRGASPGPGSPLASLDPRASEMSLGPARAQGLDLDTELLARRPVLECPSPVAFHWVCSVGFMLLG